MLNIKNLQRGSIVKVKVNNTWIIEITRIFNGWAKGKIIKTGQLCDFGLDKIIKIIEF
jgi:hypothetical protein